MVFLYFEKLQVDADSTTTSPRTPSASGGARTPGNTPRTPGTTPRTPGGTGGGGSLRRTLDGRRHLVMELFHEEGLFPSNQVITNALDNR